MSHRRFFSAEGANSLRRVLGFAFYGAWVSLGCLWMVVSAMAANDLLLLPAPSVPADRIPVSVMLDVVNTGPRIVAVGEGGLIAYSSDGGTSWTQARVPTSTTLTSVYFPTAAKGWAVGHDGVILRSCDGGETWTKQLDGRVVNRLMFEQVEEMTTEKKSRLKNSTGDDREKLASELEDLTYFIKDIQAAVEEGPSRPFLDVWFKNEREGIVAGAFGMILQTVDGGASWRPMIDRVDNHEGYHYYGIARAGSLFLACEGGLLFRSGDAGMSWQRLELPQEGSFFGIVGEMRGAYVVAFGLGGIAYRSADQGGSWEPVQAPQSGSLSGACVLSDGSVVMVANAGTLLHSIDGGRTFFPLKRQFPGCVAVAEAAGGDLVLAGMGGLTCITLSETVK